jgi:hypothetical protein
LNLNPLSYDLIYYIELMNISIQPHKVVSVTVIYEDQFYLSVGCFAKEKYEVVKKGEK